tara:strand:+ start:1818 stop:3326 length:1509 start_codon:yes stop_codon:yes gene_type:complete
MKLLALRLCAHDSNITYFDGEQVKYKSYERDFQVKHFGFEGLYSWTRILDEWNITPQDVDAVGIVLDTHVHNEVYCEVEKIEETIEIPPFRDLGFNCPIHRIDHHYAHSLSFWPLGIEPNIHFVFDGFGDDWMYRSVWRDGKLIDSAKAQANEAQYSPSFGFIMTRVGAMLQMGGHYLDQAGKVMALKAWANNTDLPDVPYVDHIDKLDQVWDFKKIEENLFKNKLYALDYVATAHERTEQLYLRHFREFVKEGDVVGYSGGIAQNTIINKVLKDNFPNLVIPPHSNDQGLSIGVLEYLRRTYNLDPFDRSGFPFWQEDESVPRPSSKTIKDTAERLAQGEIVGWYQGHGEIGPRALGNRSILMSPFDVNGKEWINQKVKRREPFRPFGASVLEEKVSEHFYWNGPSPYMLYVTDVLEPEKYPAITHNDGTCRIQTVSKEHEDYYELILKFEELTGSPVLLNTSLNVNGKPIAGRVIDGLETFYKSDLDVLVYGDTIKSKAK